MIDNSKRFRRILLFSGRATRLEFNVIIFALILLWVGAYMLIMSHRQWMRSDMIMYYLLGGAIVTLYLGLAVTFRRRHDLGVHGLKKSKGLECMWEKGIGTFNQYGSDPLQEFGPQQEKLDAMVAERLQNKKETTETEE